MILVQLSPIRYATWVSSGEIPNVINMGTNTGAKIAYFAEAEVMNRFINPDTKINTSISGIGPMFSS